MRAKPAALAAVMSAALSTAAFGANDPLSDADLVARAAAILSEKDGPVDRIVGLHRGTQVIVDLRCGDVCPANTVRIIHYSVDPGPLCTELGGDRAAIAVPRGITMGTQDFCVPHVLYVRKLYTDHPFRK